MENIIALHKDTREFCYPINEQSIFLKLKIFSEKEVKVSLVIWDRFFDEKRTIKLEGYKCLNENWYETIIDFDKKVKYLSYYFILEYDDKVVFYSPDGHSNEIPCRFFEFQSINENELFLVPSDFNGRIGYQIFPERFHVDGNSARRNVVENWDSIPTRENFFGGNLSGIICKIEYLVDLGIEILYMTPIFKSDSNHKYDTIDYFEIDPDFGTTEELIELTTVCHEKGIKVILDGVFNHIGYYSEQFQDVIKLGKKSEYWDWFTVFGDVVDTENINYDCVGYYKWMPRLNYSSRNVREYVKKIGEYWIKNANIDGWRLDVADEVDYTFWREFRKELKSVNPEIILIAESWKNASDMLKGDQVDSVMNYRFKYAVEDFIAKGIIGKSEFISRIEELKYDYHYSTRNILYNLLDSHDTERFITTCKNDIDTYSLAVLLLFTFPGIPFIYYGDEIGLAGLTDPDCRRTMPWDNINDLFLKLYKNMTKIRKNSGALKYGIFKHIDNIEGIYSFKREYGNERINVYANYSDSSIAIEFDSDSIIVLTSETIKNEYAKSEINSDNKYLLPAKGFIITQQNIVGR